MVLHQNLRNTGTSALCRCHGVFTHHAWPAGMHDDAAQAGMHMLAYAPRWAYAHTCTHARMHATHTNPLPLQQTSSSREKPRFYTGSQASNIPGAGFMGKDEVPRKGLLY
jgi:hypothetical protein